MRQNRPEFRDIHLLAARSCYTGLARTIKAEQVSDSRDAIYDATAYYTVGQSSAAIPVVNQPLEIEFQVAPTFSFVGAVVEFSIQRRRDLVFKTVVGSVLLSYL